MFHLTPQEKTALAALITVCVLGSAISWAIHRDVRPIQWATVSAAPMKHKIPDINTSTAKELEKLPGIGLKTAQNIVDYRIAHGSFTGLAELKKVKGITKKSLSKIQEYYESLPPS